MVARGAAGRIARMHHLSLVRTAYTRNFLEHSFPRTLVNRGSLRHPAKLEAPVSCVCAALLAVLLRYLLQVWPRLLEVLRDHHGMGLYGRAQSEEEGFGERGHLGGVVHVDDEVSASGTFYISEVRRLGLEV